MNTFILILAAVWGTWVLGHLMLMLVLKPNVPHFNGCSIHIPGWVKMELAEDEVRAIWFHEKGHQLHRHPWKNLLRVAILRPVTKTERQTQELEADDHAHRMGYGIALARALRKLGVSAFDNVRARRLEMLEVNRLNSDFEGLARRGQPTADGMSAFREE